MQVTFSELKMDIDRYMSLAKDRDIIISEAGKPRLKLISLHRELKAGQ